MKLDNRTPLAVMAFPMMDLAGDPFVAVIAKGTFDAGQGESLRPSVSPSSVRTVSVSWEAEKPASLRYEDDLAPFKVCTDVIVQGTAYAPGGQRAPAWRAGVRVGAVRKHVTVTGPRAWVHAPLLGWSLTPIVPVRSVPLRYELAFGGEGFEANPVGIGYRDPRTADTAQIVAAPQLLREDGSAPVFGEPYPVEGFGAIARTWQPRRARAGTFGEAWATQEGRRLPDDFDGAYWNAAHPDLCADGFIRGDEEVALTALHPEHAELSFRLPSLIVAAGAVHASGLRQASPMRLDTVFIDTDALRVELSWRTALPLFRGGMESLHIAMRAMSIGGGA